MTNTVTTERVDTEQIQVRDPYVLTHDGEYYLYGSTDPNIWRGQATGFNVYRGTDLRTWTGPYPAFRPPEGFWSQTNYWAPEVHPYRDRFYMFATFGPGRSVPRRGTAILASDSAVGPFVPHSDGPVTPREWECLDGTLHIDDDGAPWMVFCHEWKQITDGEVCAVRLTDDLRAAHGDPVTLFAASSAPWVEKLTTSKGEQAWVTDGPYLHRTTQGTLLMLWASFRGGRYAQGIAVSDSGQITGPWRHEPEPLYASDGGHGMLFRTLQGELMLTLHTPNRTPEERAIFIPVEEHQGSLRVTPA
ncbi:glycoside hydrolase family 43 protein [Nesterenkonia alba]|uniref:glycoside hydrolase family 43 protein n=1 Tax=Nesterenkonia alba TaxID=515814 RepID=UPI0003B3F3D5|nr:glycoside hydrolase family 43 protein [Nesterenkonia alba]